jgi:hypothetical protein
MPGGGAIPGGGPGGIVPGIVPGGGPGGGPNAGAAAGPAAAAAAAAGRMLSVHCDPSHHRWSEPPLGSGYHPAVTAQHGNQPAVAPARAPTGHAGGMAARPRPAVIGAADHSGWAELVTVGAGTAGAAVIDRRRCELLGPDVPRQPYHAADGLDAAAAEALVERVTRAATEGAAAALRALRDDVAGEHEVVALTLRADGSDLPAGVADVLASHTLMHAAEGALFRDALAEAAAELGLAVARHLRGESDVAARAALGLGRADVDAVLRAWGRDLGPPWRKEHREAAAAALGELLRHAPAAGAGVRAQSNTTVLRP